MGKVGNLIKLKSAIKRLSKLPRPNTSSSIAADDVDGGTTRTTFAGKQLNASEGSVLLPVYVGKSRRQYYLSSDVIDHPLFQELVDKSSSGASTNTNGCEEKGGGGGFFTVACEVVLFEHLLWMLENSDTDQADSIDELVEFYSCC